MSPPRPRRPSDGTQAAQGNVAQDYGSPQEPETLARGRSPRQVQPLASLFVPSPRGNHFSTGRSERHVPELTESEESIPTTSPPTTVADYGFLSLEAPAWARERMMQSSVEEEWEDDGVLDASLVPAPLRTRSNASRSETLGHPLLAVDQTGSDSPSSSMIAGPPTPGEPAAIVSTAGMEGNQVAYYTRHYADDDALLGRHNDAVLAWATESLRFVEMIRKLRFNDRLSWENREAYVPALEQVEKLYSAATMYGVLYIDLYPEEGVDALLSEKEKDEKWERFLDDMQKLEKESSSESDRSYQAGDEYDSADDRFESCHSNLGEQLPSPPASTVAAVGTSNTRPPTAEQSTIPTTSGPSRAESPSPTYQSTLPTSPEPAPSPPTEQRDSQLAPIAAARLHTIGRALHRAAMSVGTVSDRLGYILELLEADLQHMSQAERGRFMTRVDRRAEFANNAAWALRARLADETAVVTSVLNSPGFAERWVIGREYGIGDDLAGNAKDVARGKKLPRTKAVMSAAISAKKLQAGKKGGKEKKLSLKSGMRAVWRECKIKVLAATAAWRRFLEDDGSDPGPRGTTVGGWPREVKPIRGAEIIGLTEIR